MEEYNLIDSSYITTFDSFSLTVVKKYHYLMDVSKNINVLDDSVLLIKQKSPYKRYPFLLEINACIYFSKCLKHLVLISKRTSALHLVFLFDKRNTGKGIPI